MLISKVKYFISYYLNEDKNWEINQEYLEKSYQEAVKKGVKPKAIVIINPGNPTG